MNDRPPDNDVQPPQTDKDQSKRLYGTRKIPVTRALCHEIKALLDADVSGLAISRRLDIPYKTILRAIKRIDAQQICQIQESPAKMELHLRFAFGFLDDWMARQIRREEKGQKELTGAEVRKLFRAGELFQRIFIDPPVTRKSRRASRRR